MYICLCLLFVMPNMKVCYSVYILCRFHIFCSSELTALIGIPGTHIAYHLFPSLFQLRMKEKVLFFMTEHFLPVRFLYSRICFITIN